MCYHPLPPEYHEILKKKRNFSLIIMGKDPFPTDPIGIPFCKKTWDEQLGVVCSGRYVLESLGMDDAQLINQPVLDKACHIILCGEAKKNKWYDKRRDNAVEVCHPDVRNKINKNRYIQWSDWWSVNSIKNKFKINVLDML